MESAFVQYATILFLVVVFAAAEIHRITRCRRGRIVKVETEVVPLAALPVLKVRVRLDDGSEVPATLNACAACLGRLRLGDEVRATHTRDGWVVDLPWLRRGSKSGPVGSARCGESCGGGC